MDTNEIMTNEEVIEVAEEVAFASSEKGFKIAAGVGLGVLVSVIAYKYLVKPAIAKIKASKEQHKINEEFDNFKIINEVEESEESK